MTPVEEGTNSTSNTAMETCYFCQRGVVEAKTVTVDFRWGTELVIIENVPAKVCNECGERYYSAAVVRQMERLAKEDHRDKELHVPVVTWIQPTEYAPNQ